MRALVCLLGLLAVAACDKGGTTPPEAKEGGRYVVTGDTPFYDAGCQQSRPPDGKLVRKRKFTLLRAEGSCWHVRLDDEDETYIQPNKVRAE